MRILDMKQKEVININDGRRFGVISDIEIDVSDGKVETIIVPINGKLLGMFGKDTEYCIPWTEVKQIGDDIILVDVDSEKCAKSS